MKDNICPNCMAVISVKGTDTPTGCKFCHTSMRTTPKEVEIRVEGNNAEEVERVAKALVAEKHNSSNKESELRQLELEYELARAGLAKTGMATAMGAFAGIASLGVGMFAFIKGGEGFLSGNHLVMITAIIVFALVIQASFVFGRSAKLKLKISEKKKELEMSSG